MIPAIISEDQEKYSRNSLAKIMEVILSLYEEIRSLKFPVEAAPGISIWRVRGRSPSTLKISNGKMDVFFEYFVPLRMLLGSYEYKASTLVCIQVS
jgi:hypothetical protein